MDIYYINDDAKFVAPATSEEEAQIYTKLKVDFPWVTENDYFAIANPIFNYILQEDVITGYLPYAEVLNLYSENPQTIPAFATRNFCLASKTSFLTKICLAELPEPTWVPEFCSILFKGTNDEEYGKPYPPLASTYTEYYFSGNPEQVETHFNLPQRRGTYETFYKALVVNDIVVKVKQYCYDEQGSLSDWDLFKVIHARRIGRTDLL
jgi:hypothetical protein